MSEPPKRIPIDQLRQEEGASELASSLEPYIEYIMASMQGADFSHILFDD